MTDSRQSSSQIRFWDSFKGDRKWEWYTPQEWFDRLNQRWAFDLDPCGALHGPDLCPETYRLPDQDGLILPWHGTVFVNPPYGSEMVKWFEKADRERIERNVTSVFLIPCRSDTLAFHQYIAGWPLWFIKGRLAYSTPEGDGQTAPFPSIVVEISPHGRKPEYGTLQLRQVSK